MENPTAEDQRLALTSSLDNYVSHLNRYHNQPISLLGATTDRARWTFRGASDAIKRMARELAQADADRKMRNEMRLRERESARITNELARANRQAAVSAVEKRIAEPGRRTKAELREMLARMRQEIG